MHHHAVRTWKSLFFAALFEYYCCQTIIKIATIWLAFYLWGTNLVFSSEGKKPHNHFWLDNTNLTTTSDPDLKHSKCLAKRFLHLPSPILSPSSAAFLQPNDGCFLLWWVSTISVILTLLVYCLFYIHDDRKRFLLMKHVHHFFFGQKQQMLIVANKSSLAETQWALSLCVEEACTRYAQVFVMWFSGYERLVGVDVAFLPVCCCRLMSCA